MKTRNLKLSALIQYLNNRALSPRNYTVKDTKSKVDGVLATAELAAGHPQGFWVLGASEFEEYGLNKNDRATFIFIEGKTFAVFPTLNEVKFNPKTKTLK
jgi:hypothetical protein